MVVVVLNGGEDCQSLCWPPSSNFLTELPEKANSKGLRRFINSCICAQFGGPQVPVAMSWRHLTTQ